MLLINVGTNDLRSGELNADQTFRNLKFLWLAGRYDGFKVVAFTVHSVPCSAVCEAERVKLNNLIRSNPQLYDALVPLDTLFPSNVEPGMFIDRIHFDKAGNERVLRNVEPILIKVATTD